jgi:hypothetical protein
MVMYAFGFAAVWATIALLCVGVAAFRHLNRDWDRAFVRELQPELNALIRQAEGPGERSKS